MILSWCEAPLWHRSSSHSGGTPRLGLVSLLLLLVCIFTSGQSSTTTTPPPSSSSPSSPVADSFLGLSISSRFQKLHGDGVVAPSLALTTPVPDEIQQLLHAYDLHWSELDGNLQRLVLWDAGFILSSASEVVRVFTTCGLSMDQIIVPQAEYRQLPCPVVACDATLQSLVCPDAQLCAITRCAIEGHKLMGNEAEWNHSVAGPQTAHWAEEEANTDIPQPTVLRHSRATFSIQMRAPRRRHAEDNTVTDSASASTDGGNADGEDEDEGDGAIVATCPSHLRLAVPCAQLDHATNDRDRWCPPPSTGVVAPILASIQRNRKVAYSDDATLVGRDPARVTLWIGAALVGLVAGAVVVIGIRRARAAMHLHEAPSVEPPAFQSSLATEDMRALPGSFKHSRVLSSAWPHTRPSATPGRIMVVSSQDKDAPRWHGGHAVTEASTRTTRTISAPPAPVSSLPFREGGVAAAAAATADPSVAGDQPRARAHTTLLTSALSSSYTNLVSASNVLMAFQNDPVILAKRVPMMDLQFRRPLGRGASGEVFLGRLYGQRVAIKQLLRLRRNDIEGMEEFAREITVTASLEHVNVIRMVGVAWDTFQNLVLVLEYRAGGDLLHAIRQHGTQWTWPRDKRAIALGIARAMVYLHDRAHPLVHRDIKSRNILIDAGTGAPVLCDFGASRNVSTLDLLSTDLAGTILWSAPEVIRAQEYTIKADIFSFGIVLTELDTCALPYAEAMAPNGRAMQAIGIAHMVSENRIKPSLTAPCPQSIRDLVMACVQFDPSQRPTASEVLAQLIAVKMDDAAVETETPSWHSAA